MKTLAISTAAIILATTAATAQDLGTPAVGVNGSVEYTTEAEVLSLEAGPEVTIGALSFGALFTLDDSNDDGLEFMSSEVGASYEITTNVSAYITVDMDDEFEHTETTVGTAFKF